MKDYYIDERTGIPYKRHGDYYLPDLKVSDQELPPLGKYGLMRKSYLKEHQKAFYIQLQARGELWQHLYEVDHHTQSMVDAIVARMAEIDGVTEALKAADQMRWVGLMNNYRHCAEELVLREYVLA